MKAVHLIDGDVELRNFSTAMSEERLCSLANNRNVWINLRDRFPHPYTKTDAKQWLTYCAASSMSTIGLPYQLAIYFCDQFVGSIGLEPKKDIHSRTFELGYWIGEPFWGLGIATKAVRMILPYVFEDHNCLRLEAVTKTRNIGSARVLEKIGFLREGTMRASAVKAGDILDMYMYAMIAEDWKRSRRIGLSVKDTDPERCRRTRTCVRTIWALAVGIALLRFKLSASG